MKTKKYSYTINSKSKGKTYKIIKNSPAHYAVLFGKITLVLLIVLSVCINVYNATNEVNKCFEENSHLTKLEQKNICTLD